LFKSVALLGAVTILVEVASDFRARVKRAVSRGSPGLTNMPLLFLAFLWWARMVFGRLYTCGRLSMPEGCFTDLRFANFMLAAVCDTPDVVELIDSEISDLTTQLHLNSRPSRNTRSFVTVLKFLFVNWWSWWVRQLQSERGPLLPVVSLDKMPDVDPSRQQVALFTAFLLQNTDRVSLVEGPDGTLEKKFFRGIFQYLSFTTAPNAPFTRIFRGLSPTGWSFFQTAAWETVGERLARDPQENPFFWILFTYLLKEVAMSANRETLLPAVCRFVSPLCCVVVGRGAD
jgi:hypothetical protein